MKPLKTILIDDESIARQRLTRLLKPFEQTINIIGEASDGEEGVRLINELQPDLIFLDIQMPEKTGFELIQALETMPLIVFCTAYEEYALQAFQTLAIDYLVKPVEATRLSLTIQKLKRQRVDNSHTETQLQIERLLEIVQSKKKEKTLHSIPHKVGDRVILVKVENITYFHAHEKYVEFFTKDGKQYLTELSLTKLLKRLPMSFMQIKRDTIVNTDFIKEFRKYFRGKYMLYLEDHNATRLESGRSFSDQIKSRILVE